MINYDFLFEKFLQEFLDFQSRLFSVYWAEVTKAHKSSTFFEQPTE